MMKILLIAPYPGLIEMIKNSNVPKDIELKTAVANLEEGKKIAKLAEDQGYDLIISRGGTATMIQEVVSIPVVHIEINGYDILRAFTLISGIKQGVALVGFANITQGAATICNILGYEVEIITINSRNEVKDHLEHLKERNFNVVVGDVVTIDVAEEIGLRGVLITSGKEALADAFEESKRTFHLVRRLEKKFYYFKEAFHLLPYPLALINNNDEVLYKNMMYEQDNRYHEISSRPSVLEVVQSVIKSRKEQLMEVEHENNIYELHLFLIDEEEAVVGVSIRFSRYKEERDVVNVLHKPVNYPLIGNSDYVRELSEEIQKKSLSDQNFSIVGEIGTGKFTLAQTIHCTKHMTKASMVVIEGKYLNANDSVIEDIERKIQTVKYGSVVIKDLDLISSEAQDALYNVLTRKPATMRVIALSNRSLDQLLFNEKLNRELHAFITEHVLSILPLRDRKEDIRDFIDYFLADFTVYQGSETLGMKEEAIDYLLMSDWPGNIRQLKEIVNEASSATTNNFIELDDVEKIVNNSHSGREDYGQNSLLEGTLQEIESKVIRLVLQQENNNQSKAAERLNINRSTLWRKLK